ncbi:MAG: hypothetical protein K6A23_12375, partial [Butyrivibrio sp.]|nr:hypothetical protein [Butyrivibrio sp.]
LSAGMLSRLTCEQNNMKHIWTRIFSVYGTRDQEWTMIKYAVNSFMNGEKASFSAGTQMWNYLYESDAGKMFYLLGAKDVESGIYHIAGNDTRPLHKYIEQIKEVWDKNHENAAECEFGSYDSVNKIVGIQPDISKTIDAIGYTPEVSFTEGIDKIITWKENK